MKEGEDRKRSKVFKIILIIFCVIVFILAVWAAFSLIGRIDAGALIPEASILRLSVSNPVRALDNVLSHESVQGLSGIPALVPAVSALNMLNESPLFKNRLVRFAARGKLELALLSQSSLLQSALSQSAQNNIIAAAYDLGFLSPLFRILPAFIGFFKIPELSYVKDGNGSRFEYRAGDMTLFIIQYRNLLFIASDYGVFEARSVQLHYEKTFNNINPSAYDAVLLISHQYIYDLFAAQDPRIAEILDNLEFETMVEAGVSVTSRKLEFRLAAPLSSDNAALSRFLESRSRAPEMADSLPASAQYATILSAGTLDELYQTAVVAGVDFDDTIKLADSSSRFLLGLTLDELLFSWSGKEFAVFGMEGRPHPVFAIQISDERKRQQVFDKAFSSLFLNEDVRLNLDGVRMPRIAVPDFLQFLLRKWNIFLPSPYYTVYRDFLLVSESAETLLAALRAMQRNDVLPRTAAWRSIAGGKDASSAFSLYYSLDISVPFFLRKNSTLTAFLSLYREGLVCVSFDRGVVSLSLSLVPGSGNGVTLVNGYPLDIGGRPSNQVFGAGGGTNSRIFFASGSSVFSVNLADNSIYEFEGQGAHWVIPADGIGKKNEINAWAVSERGRVTLVNGSMEPVEGFPVLTGIRISAAPQAFNGRLYLCGEDGRVCIINETGRQDFWGTSFIAALRSPPSFLNIPARNGARNYAAVYPKSFFGEIWLLDENGNPLPNWPAPVTAGIREGWTEDSGIGFGSPVVFAHDGKVYTAFVCQSGELIVYNENAAIVSPFPLYLNDVFFLQPVYDGEYLWLVSAGGTLFRVSIVGELLYQNISGLSVREEGYLTVFDCDGDKTPEIFITGEGNALYAYTRGFRSLEGFPLPVWGKPFFIEAQNSVSRKAEIIGMGMDRRLYRWQFK